MRRISPSEASSAARSRLHRSAAISRSTSFAAAAVARSAVPASGIERLPNVPMSNGHRSVSPITSLHRVDRYPQLAGDEQAERGPVVLSDVDLAGERGDEAVGPDVDPRIAGRGPGSFLLRTGVEHDHDPVGEHVEMVAALVHRVRSHGERGRGRLVVVVGAIDERAAGRSSAMSSDARRTARTIRGYVPHRQMLPSRASRDQRVVWVPRLGEQRGGCDDHAGRAVAALHRADLDERSGSPGAGRHPARQALDGRDGTFTDLGDRVTQARTASPSSSTVHAPHVPSPHPYFAPVRSSSSRRTCSRLRSGPGEMSASTPLTRIRRPSGTTPPVGERPSRATYDRSGRNTHPSGADRSVLPHGLWSQARARHAVDVAVTLPVRGEASMPGWRASPFLRRLESSSRAMRSRRSSRSTKTDGRRLPPPGWGSSRTRSSSRRSRSSAS